MKPLDPRLLPHLTPARRSLVGVVAASTASGLLLVGQAFAVAGLVTSLFAGASLASAADRSFLAEAVKLHGYARCVGEAEVAVGGPIAPAHGDE